MGAYVNIIGKKFGKLTVVSFYGYNPNYKRKQEMYLCKCDCGNETIANKDSLLKGDKKSCGCIIGKNNFQDLSGDSLTIDRINPFANYEPSNCRWATYEEQAANKRKNYKE